MDWNISKKDNINALVIVAHPDDETVFCGGTLLVNKDWQWTIITATYQVTEQRYKEFEKAMSCYKNYGVNIKEYRTLSLEDGNMEELSQIDWQLWRSAFTTIKMSPDIVITHNTLGEYDHPDHRAANCISNELYKNVWEFVCPGAKNYPQPVRSKTQPVDLSKVILEKKKIFNISYPLQSGIWDALPDIMQYEFEKGPEIFISD